MYDSYATNGSLALKETSAIETTDDQESSGDSKIAVGTKTLADLNASGGKATNDGWAANAARAAVDQFQSNPLGTGGSVLLALAALRLKPQLVEEMAAAANSIGKAMAKTASGVPVVRSARGLADETSAVADSTFVSPWARAAAKDGGAVIKSDSGAALQDAGTVAKDAGVVVDKVSAPYVSRLDYSRVAPKALHPDTVAIPSFSFETFKGGTRVTDEAFRIVPKLSIDARVYKYSKDAITGVYPNNGAGTGFYIGRGIVATAEHVLDGATKGIKVQLANGELVSANVVAREASADWALLRLNNHSFNPPPLQFASAREVQAGRTAFLLGRPHGSEVDALTKGRIGDLVGSKKLITLGHTVESVPGMSGAPLLLENGKVAGIHTMGQRTGMLTSDATYIRHVSPARDYLRKVFEPNGIDWHTKGKLIKNDQNMPKALMQGTRDV